MGTRSDAGGPGVEFVVGSPGAPDRCKQGRGGIEFADSERGPECQAGTCVCRGRQEGCPEGRGL